MEKRWGEMEKGVIINLMKKEKMEEDEIEEIIYKS